VVKNLRRSIRSNLEKRFAANSPIRRVGWALAVLLVLTVILSSNLVPDRVHLEVGDVAQHNIKAPKDMVDPIATLRLQQEAADRVKEAYDVDNQVLEEGLEKLNAVFKMVRELQGQDLPEEEKITRLSEVLEFEVSEAEVRAVLAADPVALDKLQGETANILKRVLEAPIRQESLETARKLASNEAEDLEVDKGLRAFAGTLVSSLVEPNAILNREETKRRREEAKAGVEPQIIQKGEILVPEGTVVTRDHLVLLKEAGLLDNKGNYVTVVGAALVVAALLGLVGFYLYQFEREVFESERLIVLTGLIMVVTVFISQVLKVVSGFLMPVAAGTMLLAILTGPQLAVFVGVVLSIYVGFLTGNELSFVSVALVGAVTGVYSVFKVEQRFELMRAGFFVGLANALTVLAISLTTGFSLNQVLVWKGILWSAANGVLSAVLTTGSLPFFESLFGIITSIKLLELSNPNQPLLRRLMVEAPGTYHHSIIVGNLAEAGTEAVRGNALLARVGAYYHDIGKVKRPYFFVDNQLGGENPHNKISPSLSTLIITSHIKDGVELARAHRLPRQVIDIIKEHHGTTLVSYFYSRATENGKTEHFVEDDFRYEGPEPQSKEAAIVMLADSAEAAVRSLTNPTPGRIEGLVRKIIKDRLNEGQLDQSNLTLKDLDRVAKVFAKVLSGIFHPRVEYPDKMMKDIKDMKEIKGRHLDEGRKAPEQRSKKGSPQGKKKVPGSGEGKVPNNDQGAGRGETDSERKEKEAANGDPGEKPADENQG